MSPLPGRFTAQPLSTGSQRSIVQRRFVKKRLAAHSGQGTLPQTSDLATNAQRVSRRSGLQQSHVLPSTAVHAKAVNTSTGPQGNRHISASSLPDHMLPGLTGAALLVNVLNGACRREQTIVAAGSTQASV